jgi:hypothetical protein
MGKTPIVDKPVPVFPFFVAGQLPRQERGDDRLVVRPPELHVMPVFLHRQTPDIPEIK